jgi:LacI family transcriptional regulator
VKPVTLVDVGKRAHVSASLASLVLSGNYEGRCTAETADEVRRAATELGYRTNRMARGLRKQSTRILGLLSIKVATTPYAGSMIMAAQQLARLKDYDLLFVEVEDSVESIQQGFDLMTEHQAEGVLVFSYFHHVIDLPIAPFKNVVIANAVDARGLFDCFVPDEQGSFTQTLDLIGEAGHKHVALVTDSSGHPASIGRLKAFRIAQKKYGWQTSESLVASDVITNAAQGYVATQKILLRHPEVTAVVAFNDSLAMGAYQAAKELSLQIPEDLSITGFDDFELISAGLRPGLTTVGLPHEQMGRMAVERLIERCESNDELLEEKVEILGNLVLRQSVAAPRLGDPGFSRAPAEKMHHIN